jgi:pimeloyl-ACP methyl ester carboxylesterase
MMFRRSAHYALLLILLLPAAGLFAQVPPPEAVSLTTQDGVQLKVSYYPTVGRKGTGQAKQVTPVVLLHDHKETRSVFNSLAQRLQLAATDGGQGPSFAALTVDLRGHGESTRQVSPDGATNDLDASKLRKEDFIAMVLLDMPAVRSFLVGKNDAGELNLNKLCLVGSGLGANVAALWALQDWNWPPLAIGKQGQDVKALVLISPRWSTNGLSFQLPMRDRRFKENVAWMLTYGGEDKKVAADARRILKLLKTSHPDPSAAAGVQASSTLQEIAIKSRLQGSTLLRQAAVQVEDQIVAFLTGNVASTQHPWINRRDRLP